MVAVIMADTHPQLPKQGHISKTLIEIFQTNRAKGSKEAKQILVGLKTKKIYHIS